MYRASMASEAWPVCCLIFHDNTPAAALAVILHRMLITGEAFRWPEKEAATMA